MIVIDFDLRPRRLVPALAIALALAHAPEARAQDQPEAQAEPPATEQQAAPGQPEGAQQTEILGEQVQVEDHMDQRPKPPEGDVLEGAGGDVTVATGAGVGSDLAYASESVVELGGSLALTHGSETTILRIGPLIGYFFIDNVEITLFPDLTVTDVDGNTDVSVGGTVEPSYHAPLSDALLVFGGLGVGLKWAEDPGLDLFFRPRVGFDVLVGRSGIFKPAGFVEVGVNDGLSSGGVEAAFTVML